MTYRTLIHKLEMVPEARLDDAVTIRLTKTDEYLPAESLEQADENIDDVLDPGHLYLTIDY